MTKDKNVLYVTFKDSVKIFNNVSVGVDYKITFGKFIDDVGNERLLCHFAGHIKRPSGLYEVPRAERSDKCETEEWTDEKEQLLRELQRQKSANRTIENARYEAKQRLIAVLFGERNPFINISGYDMQSCQDEVIDDVVRHASLVRQILKDYLDAIKK